MRLFTKATNKKPNQLPNMKRQWGAEKRLQPLPALHEKPSTIKIAMSRIAIVMTVFFWLVYFVYTVIQQFFDGAGSFQFTTQAVSYLLVVTILTFSALVYLVMRQGALQRFAKHVRVPRAKLENYFSTKQPSITVLVPSYAEETEVIRKTLLSAALQEYPDMKVVLLIDDKPYPTNEDVLKKLNKSRAIGEDIEKLLNGPRDKFVKARSAFLKQSSRAKNVSPKYVRELADHYMSAAKTLQNYAKNEKTDDHVDVFFQEEVLRSLAKELNLSAQALLASIADDHKLPRKRVEQLYNRLVWTFSAKVSVFERKKFASLSHEANKAMNLNSYIGLMGGSYKQKDTPDGPVLKPVASAASADITIPDSDYLLTLDADSILLREYCLRLVYFLEQPRNARVAVTQTPYSSFRGASTRLERLAAATTDVQHILHQGMTYYNATFWVGANAVIRKSALNDIVESEWIGGFEIKRYVQDRTVIEDTESSVDLALHNWQLVNYPERLSYSATPPDFGSLVVQRRRWANGGLLILPKLFAHVRQRRREGKHVARWEVLIRLNYMASIAWASFSLIFLLAYPYDGRLLSPLVVLAAMPYFLSQASDLKYSGYKRTDVFRIYGFNLILLPVNLAGVLKSMQQSLTGKKIPFARTPKVKNRTASPLLYVLAPYLIIAFSLLTFWRDYNAANWANAAFAAFNTIVASWALVSYIGIRNSLADMWLGATDILYVDKAGKDAQEKSSGKPAIDWQAVLYHGHDRETVPLAVRADSELLSSPTPKKKKAAA